MKKEKTKKRFKILILFILIFCLLLFGINFYVVLSAKGRIISTDKAAELKASSDFDCIIVLGAGVKDGKPSAMLEDRIKVAVELYNKNAAPKIIMTGDHGKTDYDEVNIMKSYAVQNGVKSEDVFMDHAGFSTYESIYRAKEIFKAKKVIIVTQKYHLYRAIYIAGRLGLEAYGVSADLQLYKNNFVRSVREVVARDKDFFQCIFKPKPKYLGEPIPVSGNGDVTNDK